MKRLVIRKSELNNMTFFNAETIEKARKGEQASDHKYIWRKPKAKGGYDYIYADDQVKRPLEMLIKWFSFTKEKITNLYTKNNIKKDYGVTEKEFAAHLLEFQVHKNKWLKFFSNEGTQKKYKKKVTNEQIEKVQSAGINDSELEEATEETTSTPIEKKKPTQKEKPVFKPNTYLMRKIWGMFTGKDIEKEKKTQEKAESEFIAAQAENVEEEKPVSKEVEKEADTLVRVAINTNMMIENRYKADKSEKTDDKIKSLKKLKSQIIQNEKRKAKRIEELRNYNAWNDSGLGFYDGSFIKKEDVEREIKEFDDNNAIIDWNSETINIIDKEIENLKNETKESEQEKHDNRSAAMLGNDNAKKDGIINEEGENNYGENKNNAELGGISRSIDNLRRTGSTDSTGNVRVSGNESDGGQLSSDTLQPGIGLSTPETTNLNTIGRIGDGSGKLTNGQAIKIRDACHKLLAEKTDSEMTAEDKALLAQFVGAGGIKNTKNKRDNNGVLYEFYTPRAVVNKVWQLVDKYLPQKDKTCIEPSSGIGRFAENRTEKFTMFEFEEDSARIAKILHPEAEVVQGAFEKNFLRDGRFAGKNHQKFDCAVGNPPYGDYTGFYKGQGEGKEFLKYDQYFVSRTLDTLKDNGILAFVMPSNFLSSDDPKFKKAKEIIASKGKLLEAWRLPNGVFQLDLKTGTNVGTDIIIIRKEKGDINDFIGDNYFKKNPNHIAGDVVEQINFRGQPEKIVQPKNGEDFESAVNNIDINDVEAIIKELPKAETKIEEKPKIDFYVPNDKKVFDEIELKDGKKGTISGFIFSNKKPIGYKVRINGNSENLYFTDPIQEHNNRSNAMKGNKNAAGKHNFVASTGKNMTATEFNQKYGKNIDPKEMEIWRYTDYAGNIDITKLTKEQLDYIQKSDRYVKDGQKIINVVNYASGNVRDKLKELEIELSGNEITKEEYDKKKLILETVMPPTKEIGQFTLSPLADWTRKYTTKDGMSLIQGFYDWVFNGNPDLNARELPIDSPVEEDKIPPEISFGDIIDYIEKKPLTVSNKEVDDKKEKAKLRYRKSEKRRDTAEMLFNEYLKEGLSPEDREDLTKAWNDNFNSFVNPNYEQIPIFIDGMNENMGTTPFTLTEQQLKGISFLVNKGSGLLAYDVGVGKALANSENVLTPNGWVKNGSLKAGDYVIGDDGKPAMIENVYPQGIQDIYEVEFSDGSKVRCTKEHLWNVQLPYMRNKAQTKEKEVYKTIELQEFMNDLHNSRGERKYSIPMCKPVQFNKRDLLINPYLMGVLLGDGCLKEKSIWISIADDFIKNKISTMLQGAKLNYVDKYDYCISYGVNNPILNAIRKYGLDSKKSDEKFIPEDYIYSDIEDRIALLNGLFDTDGYIDNRGTTTLYYTTSKQLAEDVKKIIHSLGGTVSITGKQGSYKKNGVKIECKYCYCISVKVTGINLFTLPKKAVRVVEKTKYKPIRYIESVKLIGQEEATCIWVNNKSHLYITNDYVVTHNTVTGLCATVNQIQTGRSKRPLICVPNSVYENWIAEIHQHFPELKVNELRNFGKDYISKDWKPEEGSLSICTYEALQKVTFHEDTLKEIHEDVEFAKLQDTGDKKVSERQAAKKSEKLKEIVGSMSKTSNDNFVYFEDLGFDHITVDEVHNFKNIFTTPRNMNVNIDDDTVTKESNEFNALQGAKSDRGEKLFAITQYIQRHNDNRNVFGLSATPFQNSPIEIYNILSLFARKRMKELSIYSLEEFVKQFALLKSEYAVKANTVEEKMVMKSFKNLAALQNLITEYIDKVDGGEAHVIRPKKRVHLPKLEMTELQHQIMDAESAYITQQSLLPKKERDPGAILASLNAMRMATLSPALVSEERYEIYQSLGFDIEKPDYKEVVTSSPKLKFVCDSVIKQYKEAPKEGQVVYMPRGVTQYKYVVDYLVSHGVPKDAIATMASGNGEKALIEREKKVHEFNEVEGKCKIIIGSESIKEGVNLNGNSTILYNTMLGWNPTETTQVEGRIWRQGNRQGVTNIVYPLLNDSIDPMMYQKYDEKKNRIDNLFSYKGDTMQVEEINPEELKFGLIKDPKKRADLQTRQYKEQAESEYKMYNKLIEVLERQAKIAFSNPSATKEYKNIEANIEKEKKLYEVYKQGRKQWESRLEGENPASVKALAAKQLENIDNFLEAKKKSVDKLKRELKKLEASKINMLEVLERKGIKDSADLDKKISEYQKLALIASNNMDNAAEMFDEYYKQAVEDNEKNKVNLLPLDEQVNAYAKNIRDNLHPMDEAWKAMLIEENEKLYKKSMPLFIIKGGRFLIKK